MGKTSFALNIASYAAVHQQKKVGIFSLEMDKEKILMRMLSSGAEVSLSEMLHGYGIDQNKIFLITTFYLSIEKIIMIRKMLKNRVLQKLLLLKIEMGHKVQKN